jgi:hypothetical protein
MVDDASAGPMPMRVWRLLLTKARRLPGSICRLMLTVYYQLPATVFAVRTTLK